MESGPAVMYLTDTEGRFIAVNRQFASLFGLESTLTKGFGSAEANLLTKDKRKIPMYFTACPLTIRGKQYFTGIGIDITERKQSEKALRESEERFENLFQRAPLAYQSLDENDRFIEVNEAWLSALGYRKEEVTGKWFGDFLAPERALGPSAKASRVSGKKARSAPNSR